MKSYIKLNFVPWGLASSAMGYSGENDQWNRFRMSGYDAVVNDTFI